MSASGGRVAGEGTGPLGATPVHLVAGTRVLGPLLRVTVRGLLGRRRTILVGLLALAPVATGGLLSLAGRGGDVESYSSLFQALVLVTVVPLAALLLGTSALGAEIEDGTFVLILIRPVGRMWLVLPKLIVAGCAAMAVAAVASLGTGFLLIGAADVRLLAATALAAALAALAYSSIFVALSVWTSRALVAGLFYVLVWEGFIASLFPGTRLLSVTAYALGLATDLGGPNASALANGVAGSTGAILAAAVIAVSFALAARRLSRFQVSEAG